MINKEIKNIKVSMVIKLVFMIAGSVFLLLNQIALDNFLMYVLVITAFYIAYSRNEVYTLLADHNHKIYDKYKEPLELFVMGMILIFLWLSIILMMLYGSVESYAIKESVDENAWKTVTKTEDYESGFGGIQYSNGEWVNWRDITIKRDFDFDTPHYVIEEKQRVDYEFTFLFKTFTESNFVRKVSIVEQD